MIVNKTNLAYHMQIEWNAKTTEWFRRASSYTGFHKKLYHLIEPYFSDSDTICDFGCGAGMIDFYLAKGKREITCVDHVPEVIDILHREIQHRKIHNMKTVCTDYCDVDGTWDSGIMLFVGAEIPDILTCLQKCRKRLLIIDRGGCREKMTESEKTRTYHSLLPMINKFSHSGIVCSFTDHYLEYGQPLKSWQEAKEYIAFYRKNPCGTDISDYLAENLVSTGNDCHPWYLPYHKHFGIIEIKRKDNEHLLSAK